jgi:hypothetical protein
MGKTHPGKKKVTYTPAPVEYSKGTAGMPTAADVVAMMKAREVPPTCPHGKRVAYLPCSCKEGKRGR